MATWGGHLRSWAGKPMHVRWSAALGLCLSCCYREPTPHYLGAVETCTHGLTLCARPFANTGYEWLNRWKLGKLGKSARRRYMRSMQRDWSDGQGRHCIVSPQLWTGIYYIQTGPITLRQWCHSIYVAQLLWVSALHYSTRSRSLEGFGQWLQLICCTHLLLQVQVFL